MAKPSTRIYWVIWLIGSFGAAAALGYTLFQGEDKTVFMPGPLSTGHHQLADNCSICHSDGFGGGKVLQQACIDCHGDVRVKPFDSHPRAKFTDPRNADRLDKIDALSCISCHTEHRPEITAKNGVTQPRDVCFHCHVDVAKERPSHEGMSFASCTDAGCHNFHNNRALYTDFLVKHMDDPVTLERPRLPEREFANVLDEILEYPRDHYPIEPLVLADIDAPADKTGNDRLMTDWLETRHAAAGVNCSACHQPRGEDGMPGPWLDKPGTEGCSSCHGVELERFGKGKHGMRLASGMSPMRPADAHLPMKETAAHRELTCNSCHNGHRFDTRTAAVDACLECHDDRHSIAYEGTTHHKLWQAESSGDAAAGSGVSCATCHMPRIDVDVSDWVTRKVVEHNQSATLSPNSKMIRPACLHCHGLGFAIDALADEALIERNFDAHPDVKVDSIALARADQQRYLREREAARQ
jgi:mono/diheme cytochrome c family protein